MNTKTSDIKSPSSFNLDMQDGYHAKIPDQSPRTSPEGSIVPCTSPIIPLTPSNTPTYLEELPV